MDNNARVCEGSRSFNWQEFLVDAFASGACENLNRDNRLFSGRRYKRGYLPKKKCGLEYVSAACIALNLAGLLHIDVDIDCITHRLNQHRHLLQ